MKKVKILLSVAGLLFLTAAVLSVGLLIKNRTNIREHAAAATTLSISPENQEAERGSDATFSVRMDTGENKVIGIDVQINFDPSAIQIGSIKRGVGVDTLNNTIKNNFDNSAGTIMYTIFTLDKNQAVSGSNIEVLQINAKVTADATFGNHLLAFDSSSAVSATSESQNVLTGTVPGNLAVLEATPEPTSTSTPTSAPGQPNSCGGTCGSNTNCQSNLVCDQGFCRNPSCLGSSDCSCSATATPTPTKTPTAKPYSAPKNATPNATNKPVVIDYTPPPQSTANNFWENTFKAPDQPDSTPTLEPTNLPADKVTDFLPWIIGSLVVAGITLIFIVGGIFKEMNRGKAKPPIIKV